MSSSRRFKDLVKHHFTNTKYLNLTTCPPWNIQVCQSWKKNYVVIIMSTCMQMRLPCDLIWSTSPKWVWRASLWCKIERSHRNYPPKLSTHKKREEKKIYFALQALSLKCKVMSPRVHWTQLIQMPSHMPFLCVAVICCLGQTAYMCIIEEKHNHWGHWHSEKNWGYLMIPPAVLETTGFDVGCETTAMVSARGKPTLMMRLML